MNPIETSSGSIVPPRSADPAQGSLPDDWESRTTITVPHTARILGIGRTAAYDAVHRGELPVLRLGRRMLVPVATLRVMVGRSEA